MLTFDFYTENTFCVHTVCGLLWRPPLHLALRVVFSAKQDTLTLVRPWNCFDGVFVRFCDGKSPCVAADTPTPAQKGKIKSSGHQDTTLSRAER